MSRRDCVEIASTMKSIGLCNLSPCSFVYARFGVFGAIVPLCDVQYILLEKLPVDLETSVK